MRRPLAVLLLSFFFLPAGPSVACGPLDAEACTVETGEYRISRPDIDEPVKAMVWLHGWGGSADGVMKNRGMIETLAARGYALIAPDGLITSSRVKNKNWAVLDGREYERDDVRFIREVIEDAVANHDIDPDTVVLSGFSRGGSMVWDVACTAPDTARAYVPVAGAFWEPMPNSCVAPVDLFHIHGWTDRTVPLEGRPLRGGTMIQGDVFQSLYILRATNGCTNRQPETAPVEAATNTFSRSWTECGGGQIDFMLHPGGHGMPKGWLTRALDWFEARLVEG